MASGEARPGGLPPLEHQTLEVRDVHFLGESGLPRQHDTRQRIRALAPISHIPYRFDTNTAGVNVRVGGRATDIYPDPDAEGIYAVNIVLDEPLEPGQETEIEYSTSFNYQKAPPPEFRRRVGAKAMENLGISVVFDGLYVPARVWQSEWQDYMSDSPVLIEETAALSPLVSGEPEAGMEANARYENIAERTVGFRWEWPLRGGIFYEF